MCPVGELFLLLLLLSLILSLTLKQSRCCHHCYSPKKDFVGCTVIKHLVFTKCLWTLFF